MENLQEELHIEMLRLDNIQDLKKFKAQEIVVNICLYRELTMIEEAINDKISVITNKLSY